MLKRIARVVLPSGEASFEGYYQRLLADGSQAAPSAEEARRDFHAALHISLTGLI